MSMFGGTVDDPSVTRAWNTPLPNTSTIARPLDTVSPIRSWAAISTSAGPRKRAGSATVKLAGNDKPPSRSAVRNVASLVTPTIFVDKTDMYFGNDRMPLIREALERVKARAA